MAEINGYSSLHGHSHFSLMDGICTPDEMVLAAKEKGLISIALTDHGVTHGFAQLMQAGKRHGVKVVYGMEGYLIHDLQEWKALREKVQADRKEKGKRVEEGEEIDDKTIDVQNRRLLRKKGHLVLLAQNQAGLSNLYRITHGAHKHGMYGKPRADKKMLSSWREGLVASSACMGGVVSVKCWEFQRGDCQWDDVVREAQEYDEILGRGKFFLELQFNESEGQKYINQCMVKIHRETGIPLTVTTDSHYVKPDDWTTQEVIYMMRANKTLATRGPDWRFDVKGLYVKGPEEMWDSYLKWGAEEDRDLVRQAFENSLLIDSMIEPFEPDTHQRLPTLPINDTMRELGKRSIEALKARGFANDERYSQRLLYELKMVKEKGIANYFLIVKQIVEEARKVMRLGPGRGSAGGSIICWVNGITDIDPIEHKLMFERFINVDRIETPDIDLDFQDVDQAKEIMRKLYGEDNVACISSFGTNQIKGIMKDVGRVYDIDHTEINKVNAKIDRELSVLFASGEAKSAVIIKLEDVQRVSKTYKEFCVKYPHVVQPIERLYGRNHHVTRHASGVIIGDDLPSETSVFYSKGVLQASFTDGIVNKDLSSMGLIKFDILGLATMNIIDYALKLIAKRRGKTYSEVEAEIDSKKMDFNDQKVIRTIFHEGNFCGIFQCTSDGMRRMIMNIRPDCFEDVAACGALYRPGPLGSGMDKLYASNKMNKENVKYDHPILEEILKETYGCFVYQEHILELGRKLGKLSWKDTNRLRKLFLKRTKDAQAGRDAEAEELKEKLSKGFIENGLTQKYADKTWEDLTKWARYGFNAAHAKAYGMVTMQTAYLATYYPLEFYAAVLTCAQAGDIQGNISDIKRRGIEVLGVDVNKSKLEHVIEGDNAIRLSLISVEGIGRSAAEKIVKHQPYVRIEVEDPDRPHSVPPILDFLARSGVGKTAVHPLIMIGSFDSLMQEAADCVGPNTKALEKFYEKYAADPKLKQKKHADRLRDLFWEMTSGSGLNDQLPEDYKLHEKVFFENMIVGFSVRGSPFEILDRGKKIKTLFDEMTMTYHEFIDSEEPIGMIPVVVKEIKERAQRNGQMMAFLKFGVQTGEEFDSPCFSTIWKHVGPKMRKGSVYIGTFNRREDDPLALVVGKPGFSHSTYSALEYMIDVDGITV